MPLIRIIITTLLFVVLNSQLLYAQMERKKVIEDGPVEDIFLSGSIAGLSTVTSLPKGNMNSMV
ncbi:MAG: hypothetical protein WD512_01210, partial [Candidatus Paceibacterota bacterium]